MQWGGDQDSIERLREPKTKSRWRTHGDCMMISKDTDKERDETEKEEMKKIKGTCGHDSKLHERGITKDSGRKSIWRQDWEMEMEKELKGQKNQRYEKWLVMTASEELKNWRPAWTWQQCREELAKVGAIKSLETFEGRSRVKRKITAGKRRDCMTVVGDVMPITYPRERTWFRETKSGYEVDLTIDSGAVATIAPVDTIPGEKPRETEASRRGIGYCVANGNSIRNKGELTLRGTAENGVKLNVIAQASDVTKPLGAAREVVKSGDRIVLNEEESYIQNKRTQKKIPIKRDNGMFIVTMKIEK